MLTVSTKTRNIYEGILVGLATGTLVGLAAGLFTPAQVFSNDAANNAAVGFLVDGINNILPTCALVISVFGIMGVLSDAGMLNLIAEKILDSKMAGTAEGSGARLHDGDRIYNDLTWRCDECLHPDIRTDLK